VSAGAGVAVPGRDPVHGDPGHEHCATETCKRQGLPGAAEPCRGAGRWLPELQERRRWRGSGDCCPTWGYLLSGDQQKEKNHQQMMARPDRSKCVPNDQSELTSLLLVSLFFFTAPIILMKKKVKCCCVRWRRKGGRFDMTREQEVDE